MAQQFTVLQTVDAVVRYIATVEADNAIEAAKVARKSDSIEWELESTSEFDARNFVTLDEKGYPIEQTMQGDVL